MTDQTPHPGHEDLLRHVLRAEADSFEPDLTALDRVEWKIAKAIRVRRLRQRSLATLSAAALVIVALVATQLIDDEGTEVSTTEPTTTEGPSTTIAPAPVAGDIGIWPFVNGDDADAYDGTDYTDPAATASAFLTDYVGMERHDGGTFMPGDNQSGEVVFTTRDGGPETTVLVRRLGTSQRWTVLGSLYEHVTLDAPAAGEPVAEPVHVEGRASAFEGSILFALREDGGRELATDSPVQGEQGELLPYAGDVGYDLPAAAGGALFAYTRSAEDGSIEGVTAIRVQFSEQAGTPIGGGASDGIIVAVNGSNEIVAFDEAGHVQRTLVEAAGEIDGLALSADRETVYYSIAQSDCASTLYRVGIDGQGNQEIAEGAAPTASGDGTKLAFARDATCDGQDELVVRTLATGAEQAWPDLTTEFVVRISHLAFSPDGHAVAYQVQYEDGRGSQLHDLTEPGTVTANATKRLEPSGNETAWLYPAWPGEGMLWMAESPAGDGIPEPNAIVLVDPFSPSPAAVNHPPSEVGAIADLATDLDGEVLWVTTGGSIYRFDGAGDPHEIAGGGYTRAVW